MDGTGKIVEQGTFSALNVPGRYVHSLKIKHLQSTNEGDDKSLPEQEESTETKDVPTSTQGQDSSRQTGDWATYKYYAAALGRSKLLAFVALVTLNEASNGIQCSSRFRHRRSSTVANMNTYSCVVELVGSEQRARRSS